MFKKGVSWKDWVIRFNNSSGDLWGWIDSETEFGFLTVIDWKSFKKKGTKSGSSTTTNGVEYKETLESSTLVSEFSDSVKTEIDDFFTNGVMSSSEVVSSIFFTRDQLFRMEELSVSTSSDFINNSWFKIEEYTSWYVFSSTSFTEESVEGIITTTNGFVRWHLSIRLDTMFKAEEFPASITYLDTGLTDVDWNYFSHCFWIFEKI